MKHRKYLLILFGLIVSATILSASLNGKEPAAKDVSINLRWVRSYGSESLPSVKTGILWTLSFLGATLPKGCTDNVIQTIDSTTFKLNLKSAGFTENALSAFEVIIAHLKGTGEYAEKSSIDLGRFVTLTLNSSWHYYKITGAEPTLKKFLDKHSSGEYEQFAVLNSSVAKHKRLVKFSLTEDILNASFIAEGGVFDSTLNKIQPETYEVFDIMPNGQLRFAVYDAAGNIVEGSSQQSGIAGKPAKCLWCHEGHLQIDFKENAGIGNAINYRQFNSKMNAYQQYIDQYRATLNAEINFAAKYDHTYSELISVFFMEPTAERLAADWGIDPAAAEDKLRKLNVHRSDEYSFMNNLYHRKDIDSIEAGNPAKVPSSLRETGGYEPNYFKIK